MRIRIWNAFASNNSGSYLIVGSFPTPELAAEVAGELDSVARAQSTWRAVEGSPAPSPLERLAQIHNIPFVDDYDEWPAQYGHEAPPDVWALGHQVFVHVDCTVSMPRAIGHLMYARGGRVQTEIDHAHHPIYATFEIRFPWRQREELDVPARVHDLVDALHTETGVIATHVIPSTPAWRGAMPGVEQGFGDADLVFGARFRDLPAGFAGVHAAARAVGASVRVHVFEQPDPEVDPLAHLRPSVPVPRS